MNEPLLLSYLSIAASYAACIYKNHEAINIVDLRPLKIVFTCL